MEINRQLNLVIVDKHPLMRQGLAVIIQQNKNFKVVGEAGNAVEALEVINHSLPDCAIVDIAMKDPGGLSLIKMVKDRFPQVWIMVISDYEESFYAERALRSGARGYVTKQEAADTIADALETIRQGGVYVSEPLGRKIMGRLFNDGAAFGARDAG